MKLCAFYSHGPHYLRVLKGLRERYPEAELVAFVPPGFPHAPVAPWVDRIEHTGSGASGQRDALPHLVRRLRAERFDIFVTLFASTKLQVLARLSGARERYCHTVDGRYLPLREPLLMQGARAFSRNVRGRWEYWRIRRVVYGQPVTQTLPEGKD